MPGCSRCSALLPHRSRATLAGMQPHPTAKPALQQTAEQPRGWDFFFRGMAAKRMPRGILDETKTPDLACSVWCPSRSIDLIPFPFRGWGWGRLPGGGRRYPRLFRPKGAITNQPRAERSGNSRGATPWVRYRFNAVALKGRNKSFIPHASFVRCGGLFRPFRAGVLDTLITQGGATRLTPLRSALGCYVAAPSGRKPVYHDER